MQEVEVLPVIRLANRLKQAPREDSRQSGRRGKGCRRRGLRDAHAPATGQPKVFRLSSYLAASAFSSAMGAGAGALLMFSIFLLSAMTSICVP